MPFYDTLSSTRRRRTVPGLADEPGLDAYLTADDFLAAPGLAPDDPIEREVSAALESEGFGGGMQFTPEEAAEVDRTVQQYTVPTTLAEAMPSLSRIAPQLADLGRRGGSFLSQLATNTAPRPLPVAPAADVFATPTAPAPVVAGAVPAGAPPAVSPSSPGAQPQGAGAATPPGQPAPSPVTPAPSSDQPYQPRGELATAAEALASPAVGPPTGQSKNAPAGVRVPGARENKGEDMYGMSQTERARLDEARRGDRRMRIGSGIAQGLGALLGTIGVATDTPGLAGLGMTGMQIGRSIPAGRRAEEVLGDVERRQEALAAQNAAEARQAQLATDADRVGVQRLGAEAQRIGAEARAGLDRANMERIEAERQLQAGNAQATREFIRGRVRAAPPGPRRDAMAAATMPGSDFDQLQDLDMLADMLDAVEGIDPRGAQVAQTYAGGRGRGHWEDVDGHAVFVPERSGGRRIGQPVNTDPYAAPAAPAEAPGAVPATGAPVAAPGARPGRVAARRGRPASTAADTVPTAGQPAAAGTPSPASQRSAIDITEQGDVDRLERLMVLQGVPRGGEAWNLRRDTFISNLAQGGTVANQARAEMRAELARATESTGAGWAVGVPPAQVARVQREIEPLVTAHRDMSSVIGDLARFQANHGVEFRAALAGRPLPREGNAEIYGLIRSYYAENKHRLTGAAASDAESQELMASMGLGTLPAISDPDAFLNLMIRRRNDLFGQIMRRADNIDHRASARYLGSQYPGSRERIYSRLGYTEPAEGGR